ncbi:MAG: preprotein translocase subunit SecG [Phycisphaerae bacterium]|nr:preprotein translocase subunit SecG [Phycisphaerae bacterium]
MDYLLMTVFLIVCLLLIVVVLLQKGRGGGLGGAFGGGGAGGGAFGTRTGDVFTWVTIVLTGAFLLLAIVATVVARPDLGQVLAPTLSPAGWPEGQDAKDVKVSMDCGTRGATVRYTIDGKDPTEKSLAYSQSAVIVRRGQTLRVKAFRVGMEPSPVVTVLYAPKAPETQPGDVVSPIPAVAPATAPAE